MIVNPASDDSISLELTDHRHRDGSDKEMKPFTVDDTNLPANAHKNQEEVPEGFYRAWNGRLRKLPHLKKNNWKTSRPPAFRRDSDEDHAKQMRRFKKEFLERQYVSMNNRVKCGAHTFMVPTGEDVIIKVDRFRDEAACKACKGTGASERTCLECGGTAKIWVDANGNRDRRAMADRTHLQEVECAHCVCSTYDSPFRRSTGKQPCPACKGTGQSVGKAGITIANQYEEEPSTGVILAVGPDCKRFIIGDRVLFDQFAGKQFNFDGRKYRVMRETYPIARIVGDDDVHVGESAAGYAAEVAG
jgi:co-chaperonin GroES (HSP10)